MDYWRVPRAEDYAQFAQELRQAERENAYAESLAEDLGQEFSLPITHQITENLNTRNLVQASVDTAIPPDNIGYILLQKMGWRCGQGLGRNKQGIVEPIRPGNAEHKMGLGKQEQDDYYTAAENIERKKLDSELELTEEEAKKREELADREQRIKEEVKEITKVFFCELCNKQYKLAAEMDVHLSSYDHNHKKRFKEMKELSRGKDDKKVREQREQQRQDREMARMAQQAEAMRQQAGQQRPAVAAAAVPGNARAAVSPSTGGALGSGGLTPGKVGSAGVAPMKFGLGTGGSKPAAGGGLAGAVAGVPKMVMQIKKPGAAMGKISMTSASKKPKVGNKIASFFSSGESDDEAK